MRQVKSRRAKLKIGLTQTIYIYLKENEYISLKLLRLQPSVKSLVMLITNSNCARIREAEVDVSLVKVNYISKGTIDVIKGEGDTVEIIDFKSEKRPDLAKEYIAIERYKRQLEVYAHLVEERTDYKVSKMHVYYTGEQDGVLM